MNVKKRENSNTSREYRISSYPTLLFFEKGVLVSRMKGNISKADLLAELRKLNPGLDTSKVKLPAAQQTQEKAIPSIEPEIENHSSAMLVTDATIDSAIAQYQPLLVVVGFTNPCPYCDLFNITVLELAEELQGQVALALIDTRQNVQTREKYNITRIPATLIFKDGRFSGIVQGNKDKATIAAKLKEINPGLNMSNVSLPLYQLRMTPDEACAKMNKSDQPLLQAFVVSRCPFGLQMQRIMADMIAKSPETEGYLNVRYIGSVDVENNTIRAMHGEVEAQENLRQICIRE